MSSTKSTQISLAAVHDRTAGLDKHRESLLRRVPEQGDWAKFDRDSLIIRDLAYLTAYCDDEFALLRGKNVDILFHGTHYSCSMEGLLYDMLISGKLELIAHSHPGEDYPRPSADDRYTLKKLSQQSSIVVSATTGIEVRFTEDPFDIM